MYTLRLLPRALLPLALVLSVLVGTEPASASARCRWDSERVCHVLNKAKRMAHRSHRNRAERAAAHRMPDYGYTSKQRRAVRKRPTIDIGQPRRYAHRRHHVHKGGDVRFHHGRGRSYGCRTRWWALEEESLVFGATLYRARFTVRWCWFTEGRPRIFDVRRDWDIYDLDTSSIVVGEYRENDSGYVSGMHRTWYHVEEARQLQNCILHYGCILGSAYPRVTVTMIAGTWSGGLVRTS